MDRGVPTLVDGLSAHAATIPNRLAIRFVANRRDAGAELTYAELDAAARRLAVFLGRSHVKGGRALLMAPPGLNYIAAFFGSLYAGLVPVPIYPPRSNRSLLRLQTIARDAEPVVVLATAAVIQAAKAMLDQAPELARLHWVAVDEVDADPEAWQPPSLGQDSLAFIQYTSGSTSAPKGVALTHANIFHNEEDIRGKFQHSEDSHPVSWLPPYHDMGLIGSILQPIHLGCPATLMPPAAFLSDPMLWLDVISRFRGTTSGAPTFAYDLCARRVKPEDMRRLDLSSWDLAFCGAEPVRAGALERFADVFASAGFNRSALYPCYGLAEATLFVTGGAKSKGLLVGDFDRTALEGGMALPAERGQGVALVSCGTPVRAGGVVIADMKRGRRLPEGEVGQILVRGPHVANGYFQNSAKTQEVFGAHLDDGDGPFLATGDLGFLRDENLYVTGREKELLIIAGRNIYPHDVEAAIEDCHPLLRSGGVAAYAVPSMATERLCVAVELAQSPNDQTRQEITSAIRQRVALELEVEVHRVLILERGGIPKTSSGKTMRHALREATMKQQQMLETYELAVTDWINAAGPIVPDVRMTGPWWIFADSKGVADQVAAELNQRGVICQRIGRSSLGETLGSYKLGERVVPFSDEEALTTLVAELAKDGPVSGVLYAWGIDSIGSEASSEAGEAAATSLVQLLQSIIRSVSERPPRLSVLTAGAESHGRPARHSGVWQAPLWGLGKTLTLEHPELNCHFIDVETDADGDLAALNARNVVDRLLGSGADERIAVRSGLTYLQRLMSLGDGRAPEPRLDSTVKFRPGARYLITGGLGAIGLLAAKDMVHRGAKRLMLWDRIQPDDATSAVLSALRATGASVETRQLDLGDQESVLNAYAELAADPSPLRGVLHLAGDAEDGALLKLSAAELRAALSGRARGAWVLHEVTKAADLDFFILFSSAVSVLGSPEEGASAASNALLDGLAQHRFDRGLPALSVNWGPWLTDEAMSSEFVRAIEPEAGFELLWRLVREPIAQIAVLPFDLKEMLRFYPRAGERPFFERFLDGAVVQNKTYAHRLERQYMAPRTETERIVASIVRQALALDEVSIEDGFFELGGDSVIAGGVIDRVNGVLGVDITLSEAVDALTVKALAALADEQLSRQAVPI